MCIRRRLHADTRPEPASARPQPVSCGRPSAQTLRPNDSFVRSCSAQGPLDTPPRPYTPPTGPRGSRPCPVWLLWARLAPVLRALCCVAALFASPLSCVAASPLSRAASPWASPASCRAPSRTCRASHASITTRTRRDGGGGRSPRWTQTWPMQASHWGRKRRICTLPVDAVCLADAPSSAFKVNQPLALRSRPIIITAGGTCQNMGRMSHLDQTGLLCSQETGIELP